jgi:hypothetical protein
MSNSLIKLSWYCEKGAVGTDDNQDNPLSRAVKSTLSDGRPDQRLAMCFYDDRDSAEFNLRWFGIFILSSKNHLIFFPGFNFVSQGIIAVKGRMQETRSIQVDHITLENNLKNWHYTSPNSNDHYGRGLTTDLSENRFLWFGLSISDYACLRPVKQETVFQTGAPDSDAKRRMDSFNDSREGVFFNIITSPEDAEKHFAKGFTHFAVIVGPSGFPNYLGPDLGIPFGSPFVKEALPSSLMGVPSRLHRVSLNNKFDIEIMVIRLPGSLTQKVIITGQSRS